MSKRIVSAEQVADILTKSVSNSQFYKLRSKLKVEPLLP